MRNISFKVFFTIYGITLALCVGLQTLLKLSFMDPNTGFYEQGTVFVILLRVILIAAIGFWFISTLLRKSRHDYALNYRHLPTSILSVITGLSIIVYTITSVTKQVIHPNLPPFRQKLTLLFAVVFGALAGISMIVGGAQPTYGRYGKQGAILGVLPCVWQLIMLLSRFNYFIAITEISDIIFNILFMAFSIIFLLGQSRIIYGLGIRNGRSYAFPSGMAVSVLGFLLLVPNLVYAVSNGQFMPSLSLSLSVPEMLYILSLSVYAPVFLVGFSKSIHTV